MKFQVLETTQSDTQSAVNELKMQFNPESGIILYFASSRHNPHTLSTLMHEAFAANTVLGCTTAGEIGKGKMYDGAIVAMCLNNSIVNNYKLELIQLDNPSKAVETAMQNFSLHFEENIHHADPEKYVGIILIDGLSMKEEQVNERIGDLTNITFIGASAGDDLAFKNTYIFANGKAYTNSAILLLLHPSVKFDFLKTQSFMCSGTELTVTKSVEAKREIVELNHKPATEAYAEALNIGVENLSEYVFKNPLGIKISENDFFVRSPQQIDGKAIKFYCGIKSGMELSVLHSTDIVTDTAQALELHKNKDGGIAALINFNCILRTLDIKQQNRTEEYAQLFANIPSIGFSSYGESYIGHINQTSTMLIFRK